MMDNYREIARLQYDELRLALQRAEENQITTRDLIKEIERLLAEHQRLVEQLLEQDENPIASPPPLPSTELDS